MTSDSFPVKSTVIIFFFLFHIKYVIHSIFTKKLEWKDQPLMKRLILKVEH